MDRKPTASPEVPPDCIYSQCGCCQKVEKLTDEIEEQQKEIDALQARVHLCTAYDRMDAWLQRIANSGVEQEDPRIGYVTVQIDRDLWSELRVFQTKEPDGFKCVHCGYIGDVSEPPHVCDESTKGSESTGLTVNQHGSVIPSSVAESEQDSRPTAKLCKCKGDCEGHFNCRIVWNDEALAERGMVPEKDND